MKETKQVDKNLIVEKTVDRTGLKEYTILEKPFKIYGLLMPDDAEDKFKRLPLAVAEKVNAGVVHHHANTTGGRVRFATNSKRIAIRVEMPFVNRAPHFTLCGSAGFDLYVEMDGVQTYWSTFMPPYDMCDGYESEIAKETDGQMHEYTINMPTYSDVSRLFVMLDENAEVKECRPYKYELPVVYYGSSITQGGCASRPGNIYQNIISRRLDCNYINLGFSGSAYGEDEIAHYIANLDMSVFVYDYDHNAPTPEHLEKTHARMFNIIREKHPDIPIICPTRIVSGPDRPGDVPWEKTKERRRIIKTTVDNARKAGDNNVYFINGAEFSEQFGDPASLTVDLWHPNDLGFAVMAKVIGDKVAEVLK